MTTRVLRDLATVASIIALVGLAYILPPDTSFRSVRESGLLRACVPEAYPPLITGRPDRPGIDAEILLDIAEGLGVRLELAENYAIGRSFDPRSWRVTRAQCQVIAGGVIASDMTRSFLETTSPHLETGWALVLPDAASGPTLGEATVGFLPGSTGLDRIALSSYFRSAGATVRLLPDQAAATAALKDGSIDMIATEALLARRLAGINDWTASYLPLDRYPIAFGLWKGDLTLKRALERELARLRDDGALDRIRGSYDLAPISRDCPVCPGDPAPSSGRRSEPPIG